MQIENVRGFARPCLLGAGLAIGKPDASAVDDDVKVLHARRQTVDRNDSGLGFVGDDSLGMALERSIIDRWSM